MGLRIVTVDAFADAPFSGNPAAVCLLPDSTASPRWMQLVAREMNLSETAFLLRLGSSASFELRWFTPLVEVDLCGHATLASAHVLWEDGHVSPDEEVRFQTRSGTLRAARSGRGREVWIELEFPAFAERPYHGHAAQLSKALGVAPKYVGKYWQDLIVELESEAVLRKLSPDFGLLKSLPVRGVAVTTAPGRGTREKGYDFVSRFFGPRVGINEDPVTGSAHCALGPYWMRRLGKDEVLGYQASARGGTVRVRMLGDRVLLGGRAVTVLRGELEPAPTSSA